MIERSKKEDHAMSHQGKRLLALAVSLLVLAAAGLMTGVSTMTAEPAGGNKVVIQLTLDAATSKVTASPDPAVLHYNHKDYAEWQIAKGSAPFDFTIGIEDQKNPKKRKPAKKLPAPECADTGAAKHCTSIVPTSSHKGDQKYSVTVNTPKGPVKTDPEVTIDP
jgi:hypothetical protein